MTSITASITSRRRSTAAAVTGTALAFTALVAAPAASAHSTPAPAFTCGPAALPTGYSDALDKLVYNGAQIGGLSSLTYDPVAHDWIAGVDNHGADPARIWSFTDLSHPAIAGDPLVLKKADGTPYTGQNSDNEGLAVLPNGDYVVSSETEPSIRVYGRDGIQKSSLPVPARFAVTGTTPAGQATGNATLEGLSIPPNGREIVAAMEGALSGDVSAADATAHRFLVYTLGRDGAWKLTKQVGYRTDPGMRVAEATLYGNNEILVEEASFTPAVGNGVKLYAVTGLGASPDVSGYADLSAAPAGSFLGKQLVADLVQCPTLGATAKQPQTNPLLDNYEGLAFTGEVGDLTGVSLISDDNFGATQITRVLGLAVDLPRG